MVVLFQSIILFPFLLSFHMYPSEMGILHCSLQQGGLIAIYARCI